MSDCKLSGTTYDKDDWPLPRKPEDERVKEARARDAAQEIVIASSKAAGYADSTWLDGNFKHELTNRITAALLSVQPAPQYEWADDSDFLAGGGMIAGRCDYRYDGCVNDGEVVNGVWRCRNHLNLPVQPAASTPTEAGVCPECQGRAGLDFHDEGCGFDRSGKGETAVVLAHCTWKPTLIRCVKCSHRGDSRRVVYCPTCGCKCEFEPAASTEAKCKRCNGTGEVEGYGGNLIYCGSCAGTGKTFESQLTDFAASTEGQDESGCSNKFCTDGWVDKERGTQDGTESWVEQVPCQVCGIHCDPGPTAPASYAERAKKLVSDAIKRRVAGGSVVSRPWELIDNIAEFASAVAMETRLEGQVEMQEMIVNALGDVKNPCDVEGVDIKSDFSGGFERARVESIQAVRALSPDPNYREKLKDGERERIANSIIALHRRIYGTTELDEYNEGLNISDVLAAIESKEQT